MATQRPASEINDVAPTSLSHLVGQRGVVQQVEVALKRRSPTARKWITVCSSAVQVLARAKRLGSSQLKWQRTFTRSSPRALPALPT